MSRSRMLLQSCALLAAAVATFGDTAVAIGQQQPGPVAGAAKAGKDTGEATGQKAGTTKKDRRRRGSVSRAVHQAWLKEVLDLDVRGAAQAYDKIRKTASRKQPERWLAVTRLAELSRLGVASVEPLAIPQRAPSDVQDALKTLAEPLPYEELLRAPNSNVNFPKLRPATRMTQTWVRNQVGPTVADRRMRLLQRRRNSARSSTRSSTPSPSNNEWRARWNAMDILYRELEGRRNQAAALRTINFPSWKPVAVRGTAKENVAMIIDRLNRWIDEEESSRRRAILRDLKKGFDTLEAEDPNAAVQMISRLPRYAERLLGPAMPAPAKPAEPRKEKAAITPKNRDEKDDR